MGGGADVNPNILRRMLSKYSENGCITKQKFSQAMNDQDCLDVGGTMKDLDEVYNMLIERGGLQNSDEKLLRVEKFIDMTCALKEKASKSFFTGHKITDLGDRRPVGMQGQRKVLEMIKVRLKQKFEQKRLGSLNRENLKRVWSRWTGNYNLDHGDISYSEFMNVIRQDLQMDLMMINVGDLDALLHKIDKKEDGEVDGGIAIDSFIDLLGIDSRASDKAAQKGVDDSQKHDTTRKFVNHTARPKLLAENIRRKVIYSGMLLPKFWNFINIHKAEHVTYNLFHEAMLKLGVSPVDKPTTRALFEAMDWEKKGFVVFDDFAKKFHPSGERRKFSYNYDKDAKPWEKPESTPYVHGLKDDAEGVTGHHTVWSTGMRKLKRIVQQKAERKSLSTSMGNCGVPNPSVLKLLLCKFSKDKKNYLNVTEFIQALRTSTGLDVKNVPDKDFVDLFNHMNSSNINDGDHKKYISIDAFCKMVIPQGIVFAGKAAISTLFADQNKTDARSLRNGRIQYKFDNPPWDQDNSSYNSRQWQSTMDSTINESGRTSSPNNFSLHRRASHTIKALHEVAGNAETRTRNMLPPKNESSRLGVGSAEAAKLYYRRNGGGLFAKRAMSLNASKPPNTTRFRRESLVGNVLREDTKKRPIISNHQATIGATSKMKWPKKEIQLKLASETSHVGGPLRDVSPRGTIYNVYGAVQKNVPSRPSTASSFSRNQSPRRTPRALQATPSSIVSSQADHSSSRDNTTCAKMVTSGTQTSDMPLLKLHPYWKGIHARRTRTSVPRQRRQLDKSALREGQSYPELRRGEGADKDQILPV
eukprot:g3510.t1